MEMRSESFTLLPSPLRKNAETLMDVVWIFKEIFRIIYEKREKKFGDSRSLRRWMERKEGKKCIQNISRKTYISDASGGCDHINYTNIIQYREE